MVRLRSRIVAILLLPCLPLDPSLAALHFKISTCPVSRMGAISPLTDTQAIVEWAEFFHFTLARRRSGLLKSSLRDVIPTVRSGPTLEAVNLTESGLLGSLDPVYLLPVDHYISGRFPFISNLGFDPIAPHSIQLSALANWINQAMNPSFKGERNEEIALRKGNLTLQKLVEENLEDPVRFLPNTRIAVSRDPEFLKSGVPVVEVVSQGNVYFVFNRDWINEMLPIWLLEKGEMRIAMTWILAERLAHAAKHERSLPKSIVDWEEDEQRVLLDEAERLHALRYTSRGADTGYQKIIDDFFQKYPRLKSFKSGWLYRPKTGILAQIWEIQPINHRYLKHFVQSLQGGRAVRMQPMQRQFVTPLGENRAPHTHAFLFVNALHLKFVLGFGILALIGVLAYCVYKIIVFTRSYYGAKGLVQGELNRTSSRKATRKEQDRFERGKRKV